MLKNWKDTIKQRLGRGMAGQKIDLAQYRHFTTMLFVRFYFVIAFTAILGATITHLVKGQYRICLWNSCFLVIMTATLVILHLKKEFMLLKNFLAASYLAGIIIGLYEGGFADAGLMYLFSFPITVFFIFDRKAGIIWNLIFLAIYSINILLVRQGIIPSPFPLMELLMGGINFCVIAVLVYLYAYRHYKMTELVKFAFVHDKTTGLPNTEKLKEDLERGLGKGLILIKMNDHKELMNVVGMEEGEQLLLLIMDRLKQQAEKLQGTLYYLHESEFGLLIPGKADRNNWDQWALQIIEHLETGYFFLGNRRILIRFSLGIARRRYSRGNLLTCAGIALKKALQAADRFYYYRDVASVRQTYNTTQNTAVILNEALEYDRVFPYYQPVVNLKTGKPAFFECLIRIADSFGRVYSPGSFLNVANRLRQYHKLTQIMIEKAFLRFSARKLPFSVNLSVEDFSDQYFRQFIMLFLQEHAEDCHLFHFEILESESIINLEEVTSFIRQVKKLGCKIIIDNFGSGYSNYDYLVSLDFDIIKIDGSLIKRLNENSTARLVVKNIVDFASLMNIRTVAQFVYSREIYQQVVEMQIDYAQGYYLGKPAAELPDGLPHLIQSGPGGLVL